MMIVGLISDTHGLIRPDVARAFAGVDLIVHAGDVGGQAVLAALQALAPVEAVFGNVDDPHDPALAPARSLPVGRHTLRVSHGHELGSPTPEKLVAAYSADIIVYGHTHKPVVTRIRDRLVINPGAAGPRRFHLEPSIAILRVIADAEPLAEIVRLAL